MPLPETFPLATIATMVVVAFGLVAWTSAVAAHASGRRAVGIAVGVGLSSWLAVALYLSHVNFVFSQATPVYSVLFPLGIPIVVGSLLLARPGFRKLVAATPQSLLIAPHLLRAVGFSFVVLAELGYLPTGFGYPAGYGDVFTAVLVPLVLYLILTGSRWTWSAILVWNAVGLLDLVAALTTGPLLIQGHLATVGQPYALNYFTLIPAFAVPLFVLTHIYSLVKLAREREAPSAAPHPRIERVA